MGKLLYFLMKNVTFRVLFTEGGTLWKKVPKRGQKVIFLNPHFGAIFERKQASGPFQKNTKFEAVPKMAEKRHLGAQGAQKVPKREHFGGLFGTFSGSDAKSENGALA